MSNKRPVDEWHKRYEAYLVSPEWQKKRAERLVVNNFICQPCHKAEAIQVHHLKYPKIFGIEPLSDLISVCRYCHLELHKKIRKAKRLKAREANKARRKLTSNRKQALKAVALVKEVIVIKGDFLSKFKRGLVLTK